MTDAVKETMLHADRNTAAHLEYYRELETFFREAPGSPLAKLRSFAVYTPRQVITEFLVRYELFRLVQDVPGSIVECGVFDGQGLFSFAQFSAILEPNHLNRVIFGFDTFAGFAGLHANDTGTGSAEHLREGGYASHLGADDLRRAVALFDANRFIGHVPKIEIVQGDLTETLDPFLAANPHLLVALLYLDLDLYEPTRFALQRLLPRVPQGGIVAFDELNVKAYPGETRALLDSLELAKLPLRRLPFCSRISYFKVGGP